MPIAKPRKKKKDKQLTFDEWTEDRIEENKTVNEIRRLVKIWREGRYKDDVTRQTARLLEYGCRSDRTRRLFFCQIEALETLIYIMEMAKKEILGQKGVGVGADTPTQGGQGRLGDSGDGQECSLTGSIKRDMLARTAVAENPRLET